MATIIVRKTIHFTFYGLMAWFAVLIGARLSSDRLRAMLFAALWTLAHSAFDEMRQNQTTSRTGTILDVLLDLTGVAFALFIWNRHQIRAASR